MDKLKPAELAEYKEVFAMFDKDGDGTIDSAELGTVMASLGVNPSATELQEMIEEVDTDKNGTIDFNEFCNLMISKTQGLDPEHEIHNVFKIIDKDGDGVINFDDLAHIVKQITWGNDKVPTADDLQGMLRIMNASTTSVDFATFRAIILGR